MKKTLAILLVFVFTSTAIAANKRFDTMVVFGDSVSDNGNLYSYMWGKIPASPPYFEGRFSNGPLWVEQLYNSYLAFNNNPDSFLDYAVAGAGAVLSYKQSLPYTLYIELNNYFYWHTYGKKDTTLYTLWIGANNYLNGPTNVEAITDSVVNAIVSSVERLIGRGGNKFLIVNLPDLGLSPITREKNNSALVSELVSTHNHKLEIKVEELKQHYPEAIFVYFDVYSYFSGTLTHATDFGLTNVEDACYLGGYLDWLIKPNDEQLHQFLQQQDARFDEAQWQMIANNPELKEAVRAGYIHQLLPKPYDEEKLECETYAFWDRIHPTTKLHQLIAGKARQVLDDAGLEAFTTNEGD